MFGTDGKASDYIVFVDM
jgi:hypothetical protein